MSSSPQRHDIQSLRRYAVLLVVLFHARLVPVPVGHLGVDVIFVISGFLMTGLIAGERDRGVFAFRPFYFRRAERRSVPVIRLPDVLCAASLCRTMTGPWSLYWDGSHLSYRGSVDVATRLHLAERGRREAR